MAYEIGSDELKKLQQKSLEMAKYFLKICRENGLLCYLCGGCCIGAVRGGGFVPWDDDIDFFMPRPDYERLIRIWDKCADTKRYSLQVSTRKTETRNQFLTICDNNTTYIKSYMADLDINHGLSLDIIPLDGRPKFGKLYGIKRKMQIINALVYSLCIIGKAPTNHGKAVETLGKIFLGIFRGKRLRFKLYSFAEKCMSKYNFYGSEYVAELTTGPVFMKRDYPTKWFINSADLPFEDTKMPVPVGYDEYLTMAFGDYMTPPPESERTFHHDFEFIDMDHPYTDYKGIYYCKE